MIAKLKSIARYENMKIEDNVFEIITDICEGDARRSINTLQNIKYIPNIRNRDISKEDIYNITSFMDKSYFDPYWKQIISSNIKVLNQLVINITNTGYPLNYILQCIKDKVIDSKMTDRQMSDIILHIGKVERMITSGSDNYLQLFAVFSYINGIYRKFKICKPFIY